MFGTFLDGWRRVDDAVAVIERIVVAIAALAMVLLVFAQSMLRFFADYNLYGATNWATVLLVWVGFLSASLATREKRHIVVDAVPRLLGERRAELLLAVFVQAGTAALLGYLVYASLAYLDSPGVQFRRLMGVVLPWQDMPLETKYVVVVMPVALSLMTLRFLQLSLEDLAIWLGVWPREKRRVPSGIEELLGGGAQSSGGGE
ncbi:MAG: TRAP transporter small permease [Candidatus Dadabacteria bacterium]|nr:MAG: TRAP transporter small permease [Candidatus Dadabacteria bacterium]